ncbi:PTS IIA-like nitrogen regulatory protein PtsN [Maritalea porphyrae]|jgi:PTS system nitrogen regulatory IIA component|uniref:PTS IIA-like nitrogen regulatory protein PtsN n=1 Tax=Maritalea porphyrae TaxID=880732 RepID=UPI0022AF00D8|nr:PTS IIA-like nitrogen regulatory protein PtsN [Maritalea porphyrae]MCZ4271964.1 PTS IIA-like nitrogen regulatory protein PtsN [Maritalea porphyrae]
MELADILTKEAIVPCAKATCKRQLLQLAADKAAELVGGDALQIFKTLTEREQLGTTGLGEGIAIPHGKIDGLKGVTCVFVRLDHPIDFDAVDDKPVDLAFVLLAPKGAGADHLKALSRIARLVRSNNVAQEARKTRDAKELYQLLTRAKGHSDAA